MEIRADVFDIRASVNTPSQSDKFLIDSNVWIWFTYPRIQRLPRGKAPKNYQLDCYPNYVQDAIDAGSDINAFSHCEISLSELAHCIENAEFQLFVDQRFPLRAEERLERQKLLELVELENNPRWTRKIKLFRNYCPLMRSKVVRQIKNSWKQVQSSSESLETKLCKSFAIKALQELHNREVDAYDLLLVQGAIDKGITKIITDDRDFVTVEGIEVYTANETTIEMARRQRRLRG